MPFSGGGGNVHARGRLEKEIGQLAILFNFKRQFYRGRKVDMRVQFLEIIPTNYVIKESSEYLCNA